jgi:hypothetical protein
MSTEGAMPSESDKPRFVLHRLRLDDRKVAMFAVLGAEVVHVRSVPAAIEALRGVHDVVVVDLALGSNAPERIAEMARARRSEVIVTTTNPTGGWQGRAKKMGVVALYAWAEGVTGELLRRLPPTGDMHVRRLAERADVRLPFDCDSATGGGEVVNIGASGAMLEVSFDATDIEAMALNLTIGAIEVTIEARTAWCERLPNGGTRLGVQFVNVDAAAALTIARYVRAANELRVVRGAARPARADAAARGHLKVRVQREGTSRIDYFLWTPAVDGKTATLVPKKPFFVPYAVGDVLLVRGHGRADEAGRYRVIDRILVEPDRLDSPIQWRLAPAPLDAGGDR